MKKGCREDSLGFIIPLRMDFVRMNHHRMVLAVQPQDLEGYFHQSS